MNADLKSIISDRRNETTLFVLKGFSLENAGKPMVNLDKVFENKLSHLMQIANSDSQVISFDEFVCLYDLCVLQYRKILILENPLFWNFYPPEVNIPQEISRALLAHFDPEIIEHDDGHLDLSDYLQVYSNYLLTDQGIACRYNISEFLLRSERIEILVINQPTAENIANDIVYREKAYLSICNETDYFQLVSAILNSNDVFSITGDNFVAGKDAVQRHIDFLCDRFHSRVFKHENETVFMKPLSTNPQISGLLNKYWRYDSFREVKIYDLNEVKNHRKKVTSISQERIISDLIEQVENCISGKSFRDIFVTAPTGAGKSLIFQLPAIYIAEKFDLVTLVVTPLIGLMNDQVQALAKRGYHGAKTINSDISPVIKQEILQEVFEGTCSILYLSPESLLSRSDVDQLIGSRKIGMLIIDEAHIVTTWGKQFRPDYWYLGDHVQKLRRAQSRREIDPSPFIIATFTATAIYEGHEDMYHETLNSLHMIDPITYLGYVKRSNISIDVKEVKV